MLIEYPPCSKSWDSIAVVIDSAAPKGGDRLIMIDKTERGRRLNFLWPCTKSERFGEGL